MIIEDKRKPAFIVAGTHSGVGKTTITLALIRALIRSGLSVQPFKIGPDFIDTAYHSEAAGRASMNLDAWMMGTDHVQESFQRFARDADIAVIESMGALFDGENGTERGSAAFMAKLLGVPVVLVIDIWGMTRSAVPLLQGFLSFDPGLSFAGFVMNRAGSERHAQMAYDALPPPLQGLSLGHVVRRPALEIPERHLGLITIDENSVTAENRRAALDEASAGLKVDALAPRPNRSAASQSEKVVPPHPKRARIAVARDRAFCFYYAENLALLEEAGAELCPFSPTSDPHLPEGVAGVYIGGGYPESFVEELSRNDPLRTELQRCAVEGMPIYAECGGFMYLGRSIAGFDRPALPMAAVFPIDTVMDAAYLAIRYVSVQTLADSLLGPAGTEARGQEFHQSRIVDRSTGGSLYRVVSSTGEEFEEGFVSNSAVGSYIHLHFASNAGIPRNFVDSCAKWFDGARSRTSPSDARPEAPKQA